MIKPLRLMVLTPAETLLDAAEVAWVQVQLSDGGGIGIYPGHAPLLAETVTALLRYADELGERALDLKAGILQVEGDGVTIFTSGLAQTSEVLETSEVSDGERFDRLARALLATLQAQPGEGPVASAGSARGLSGACPEPSRGACPEPSRRACPEPGRRACPEPSRRACPEPSRRVEGWDADDEEG